MQKKSVEKLEEKLISLYKAIEDATVNSIEASKESIPLRQPYSVRGLLKSFDLFLVLNPSLDFKNAKDYNVGFAL